MFRENEYKKAMKGVSNTSLLKDKKQKRKKKDKDSQGSGTLNKLKKKNGSFKRYSNETT